MGALLTVSEITKEIKQILEDRLSNISIIGEISGFKAHVSGHWYFSLKDADAIMSVVMFRGRQDGVRFTEVSLGYPQEQEKYPARPRRLTQILPSEPASPAVADVLPGR